ncbi:MAG TPA: glycosyltransferase 87 family protein [Amycolatopsis sp.]|uniref:glycosyltransferase 87 family protein n=1 Tax=Amycolatopsis sp. TaxID=37632 RepID=UPI002B487270|nr:glycosyltransferase 87 family protein [Amycolatopsis sp.]HKS49962.1 glycosyltransferase 87 family protein [Amycolatopsis sp.]
MTRAVTWAVPLIAVLVLAVEFPWRFEAHLDLEVYRMGVRAWWHGGDIYGPLGPTSAGIRLPFIYPPFAVAALGPLAALPWNLAVVALFAANLLCLGGTLFLVTRHAWPAGGLRGALLVATAAVPVAMALEPLRETFAFGQVNLLLMGLVAADCLTATPRWPRGIGVGLAAAIKLTPLAFLLFFLVRKDYRAAGTAVVTALAASAVGFAIDARASVKYWFGGLAGAGGLSGSPYRTNQSVEAVLVRLGLPSGAAKFWWIVLALVLLVLAVTAMRRSEPVVALAANAGFALLASPISWSHHWIWVAPALLMMALYGFRRARERRWGAAAGWWGSAALTGTLCTVAPFRYLSAHDKPSMVWSIAEQVPGNAYALLGTLLLVTYALTKVRRAEPRADAASP